ncbi:MAG: hypothetical protein DIZ80_02000 [endosymbiont of Galathealinum brachiosum]|uniref:Solute-binding protein family 3/N-terminal domain-containing protein n=1 Tax=endosymbiont of Galathealinum brachiosum TaxID=2200906 RepID=A0A370DLK3_9GAMM|nr:MAG: hypothetical protein DIZ80_02000 [endosymbiont of Galathealinum brachiosum]
MIKCKRFICFFLISFFLLYMKPVYSGEHFVLNSGGFPPFSNSERNGFEDLLSKEMYKRAGISITINQLPSERGLRIANEGLEDGIHSRVKAINKKYKNLLPLEEPTMERQYVAYAKDASIKIDGWKSLSKYNIAIITGWKILEWNIINSKSLIKVRNSDQLFKLLENGRVDVIVFTKWGGLQKIKDLNIQGIYLLDKPLAKKDMYFFLHKKHRELVPRLSAILREIKKDGTYKAIFDETMDELK